MARSDRLLGDLKSFEADPQNSTTWLGLQSEDREVLATLLELRRIAPTFLATGVYCGCIPAAARERAGSMPETQLQAIYCMRCDVVFEHRGLWFVCEVKPDLGPEAIGQAITYAHLIPRAYRRVQSVVSCVLCLRARAELFRVAREAGRVKVVAAEIIDEERPTGLSAAPGSV